MKMVDLGISKLWNNSWNGFHIMKETFIKSEVIFFKTVQNWPGFALQTRWFIIVFSILVAC